MTRRLARRAVQLAVIIGVALLLVAMGIAISMQLDATSNKYHAKEAIEERSERETYNREIQHDVELAIKKGHQ